MHLLSITNWILVEYFTTVISLVQRCDYQNNAAIFRFFLEKLPAEPKTDGHRLLILGFGLCSLDIESCVLGRRLWVLVSG